MRSSVVSLLALVLLGGCGGEHVVGAVPLCCYDSQLQAMVPSCADQTRCVCMLALCGAGAACRTVKDCAMAGEIKVTPVDCVADRCVPAADLPRAPPGSACSRDSECEQQSGCVGCSDGSRACYVVRCLGGICSAAPPACGCRGDSDCIGFKPECTVCTDGLTRRCLTGSCVAGQCVVEPGPACPKAAACTGDGDCGAPRCLSCSAGKVCGSVWCSHGECQATSPSC